MQTVASVLHPGNGEGSANPGQAEGSPAVAFARALVRPVRLHGQPAHTARRALSTGRQLLAGEGAQSRPSRRGMK
jgi:hypothetical protein